MPKEEFPSFNKPPKVEEVDQLLNEKFRHEKEFKNFLLTLKTIDADKDVVNDKPREYITSIDAYRIYTSSFKKEALAPHSISYRLRNIKAEDFPDDFIVDPTEKKYEPKYYINRLNEVLLKKIFLPRTEGPIADFHKLKKLNNLDQMFRNDSTNLDEDDL